MAQQRLGFLLVVVAAAMAMSLILNVPKADAQIPPIPPILGSPPAPLSNVTGIVTNLTGTLSCLNSTISDLRGINVTLRCGNNITATATTNSTGHFILFILRASLPVSDLLNGTCVISVATQGICIVKLVPGLLSGIGGTLIGLLTPVVVLVPQIVLLLFNLIGNSIGTVVTILSLVRGA